MRLALLVLLSSCSLFAQKKPQPVRETKPKIPAWTSKTRFYEKDGDVYRLYGVGKLGIPKVIKGDCPAPHLLANRALGRARAEIVALIQGAISVAPGREVSAGELLGSEPAMGWHDDQMIYVAAKLETSTAPKSLADIEIHKPEGGVGAGEVVETVKAAMVERLDADGICKDPHRRLKNKCCGGPAKFCSDATRYNRKVRADVCACGLGHPCHFDFTCKQNAEGKYRCECQGPKCPCSILNCKIGQTCGDGRCF